MVYFQTLQEILSNPVHAILKAKKERNTNKSVAILFVDWVLFALGASLVMFKFAKFFTLLVFFSVFVLGLLGSLFFSLLVQIIFNILGSKGKYFDALTALAYSKFPLSLGVVIVSVLSYLPLAGLLISIIVLSIFGAMAIATFYRGLKELFGLDIITTWIGIGLLMFVLFVAFYLGVMINFSTNLFLNKFTQPSFPLY
mgnify:CR=1 FL=1